MHSARKIRCKCGTSYCFKCSKEIHRPCSCEMYEKWNRLNDNSRNDEKWIEANTKECPHCHQKIEKIRGCNYLYFGKKVGGCRHTFCYVCETDWLSILKIILIAINILMLSKIKKRCR